MEANCWTVRGASPRAHHVRAAESGSHQMWQCALKKASGLIWCIRHLLLRGWLFLCKQVPQMTHVALSFWWDGSCGRTGSTKPWRHAVGSSEMSPWGGWDCKVRMCRGEENHALTYPALWGYILGDSWGFICLRRVFSLVSPILVVGRKPVHFYSWKAMNLTSHPSAYRQPSAIAHSKNHRAGLAGMRAVFSLMK